MTCRVCKKKINKIINFGKFPVSHKFKRQKEKDKKFGLKLGICSNCNLVQLKNLFPLSQLKPKYEWINYNEPEEHLDKLVKKILNLKNITKKSIIAGVSYKEFSTLKRFEKIGFKNTWLLDVKKDLNIKNPKLNLETIQEKISKINTKKTFKSKKRADVLIVRHILEHSYDTNKFIKSVKNLIKDDGYLIFEVPDCKESFVNSDYTMLWEEHVLYFTEHSLKNILINNGLTICYFEKYKYSYEDILIVVAKINNNNYIKKRIKKNIPKINFNNKKLSIDKLRIRKKLENFHKREYKIGLFGTGHAACTFLNILKLHDLIDFVVDDDKNKYNLFLPNSQLQIKKTANLNNFKKILIILGVNSESEKKVVLKLKKIDAQIKYFSVYNKSKFNFNKI